ncbi:MAG TPA: bifunctional ADP-heptose synthase [Bacteroidales bacterium]|nr:bifunctional ADP-heptose synthase [Bacteroidales bacterium]
MVSDNLKTFFKDLTSKRILIIGDVMIDAYMWGKVDRISPEAPVPVVTCTKQDNRLGGAANVAINIAAMGANPILCGIIGNDDKGTLFLKLMQDNHLSNAGICIVKGRKTTIKTRIIGGNQHLLRIDDETTQPLEGAEIVNFSQHLFDLINELKVDAIIFQDYDKGLLTPALINEVIHFANKKDIPVLVDPKKRNFHAYHGATLFKPNFKEFCEGLKVELSKENLQDVYTVAKDFLNSHNIKILLLTMSEKGVMICTTENFHHIPAHVRDIADVSGAGDTVISVATLGIACNLDLKEVAEVSNLSGGLVCEKVGVVPVDKAQLEREVRKYLH